MQTAASAKNPSNIHIPPVLQQNIGVGATYDESFVVNLELVSVAFDVPADVDAFLELDGERVHSVTDSEGESGQLVFGDDTTKEGRPISRARARITNNAAAARNVKYLLYGVSRA